jgi:hypothetical protein
MGSRLSISLVQLINHPGVCIKLYSSEDVPVAEVEFSRVGELPELLYRFDLQGTSGSLELATDWNWFRYDNSYTGDHSHPSRKLLRMLFEYGIDFKVIH